MLLFGPVPNQSEQFVIFLLMLLLPLLGVLVWGSPLLRWISALNEAPKQYKKGKEKASNSGQEENEE
ncbi:hypothetical protein SAMN05421858_2816 [Haladaptatus litoreus]|uniref:Uncharacterized protein n=1 Tax=Haladaptatus litoreus TaxID=553468 RepID=A0A1N7BXC5_9EURY|nr:hypothetical protein SAMN05421858_2816 [Haladaptatus litoreus]